MSGVQLARQMVARHPQLRVIFASGVGQLDIAETGVDAEFLPKPYDLIRIKELLTRVTKGAKAV
jgi:DNA-binding NtrC family response regulator